MKSSTEESKSTQGLAQTPENRNIPNIDQNYHYTTSRVPPAVTRDQMAVKDAKVMLFTCMDFRLLDNIVSFMNDLGYNKNYDQFILAGSSLAFAEDKFLSWRNVALEHLGLAVNLHHVDEVICIDHDACGAYKVVYPDLSDADIRAKHAENVEKFKEKVREVHPGLKISTYYMFLDGSCLRFN